LETQKQIKKLLFIETNNADIEVVINSFVKKKKVVINSLNQKLFK